MFIQFSFSVFAAIGVPSTGAAGIWLASKVVEANKVAGRQSQQNRLFPPAHATLLSLHIQGFCALPEVWQAGSLEPVPLYFWLPWNSNPIFFFTVYYLSSERSCPVDSERLFFLSSHGSRASLFPIIGWFSGAGTARSASEERRRHFRGLCGVLRQLSKLK